jgi:hypothetical protein
MALDSFDEPILWAAVLEAGIVDHLVGVDTRWVHSPDFDLICQFVGYDADELRRAILALDFDMWAERQSRFNRSRKPTFAGIRKWCMTFAA